MVLKGALGMSATHLPSFGFCSSHLCRAQAVYVSLKLCSTCSFYNSNVVETVLSDGGWALRTIFDVLLSAILSLDV